jgi:hypothetical protein
VWWLSTGVLVWWLSTGVLAWWLAARSDVLVRGSVTGFDTATAETTA